MPSPIVANPMNLRGSRIAKAINGYQNDPDNQDNSVMVSGNSPQPGAVYQGYFDDTKVLGQPFAIYLGMVLALFLLKFISESDATSIDPAEIHIGGYNLIAVGVTATVFIAGLKILSNRFPVPGLTELMNFV